MVFYSDNRIRLVVTTTPQYQEILFSRTRLKLAWIKICYIYRCLQYNRQPCYLLNLLMYLLYLLIFSYFCLSMFSEAKLCVILLMRSHVSNVKLCSQVLLLISNLVWSHVIKILTWNHVIYTLIYSVMSSMLMRIVKPYYQR